MGFVACRPDRYIRGSFHDNFPVFSGFGFCRKLVRTKNQQGTEKASKNNGRTVFSRALIFHMHQQKWHQICFIIYPIFILLPQNLHQIPFSPPPQPLPYHAAAIIHHMSVSLGGTLSLLLTPPPILHPILFLC